MYIFSLQSFCSCARIKAISCKTGNYQKGQERMRCKEWQKMIPGFLEDTLENREMEGFIEHVQACEDCYEELEIMFMLSIGLQELNEDRNISYNFSQLLENKIVEAEIRFERIRRIRSLNRLVILILHLLVMLGVALQIVRWI